MLHNRCSEAASRPSCTLAGCSWQPADWTVRDNYNGRCARRPSESAAGNMEDTSVWQRNFTCVAHYGETTTVSQTTTTAVSTVDDDSATVAKVTDTNVISTTVKSTTVMSTPVNLTTVASKTVASPSGAGNLITATPRVPSSADGTADRKAKKKDTGKSGGGAVAAVVVLIVVAVCGAGYYKYSRSRRGGAGFASSLQGHFLNPLATNDGDDDGDVFHRDRRDGGASKNAWYE
jgi:hypothetical protein